MRFNTHVSRLTHECAFIYHEVNIQWRIIARIWYHLSWPSYIQSQIALHENIELYILKLTSMWMNGERLSRSILCWFWRCSLVSYFSLNLLPVFLYHAKMKEYRTKRLQTECYQISFTTDAYQFQQFLHKSIHHQYDWFCVTIDCTITTSASLRTINIFPWCKRVATRSEFYSITQMGLH